VVVNIEPYLHSSYVFIPLMLTKLSTGTARPFLLSNIIRAIRLLGHVVCIRDKGIAYKFLIRKYGRRETRKTQV
jgi:hypothetical protein